MPEKMFLILVLLPLLDRAWAYRHYGLVLPDPQPEEEKDRASYRGVIMVLAGFSISLFIALVVLDAPRVQEFELSVQFLLVSFLLYMFALFLQGWKQYQWHDHLLGDGVFDAANLSLTGGVLSVVWDLDLGSAYAWLASLLGGGIWLVDHVVRLRNSVEYLKGLAYNKREGFGDGTEQGR